MGQNKLSKQRIDRILTRYYETLQATRPSTGDEALMVDSNVTVVSGGKWDSAQVHRRKHIVKRILIDFEKREMAPQQIPVQLI